MDKKDCHPMISVIIPCYNYGRFLPAAIESLRQQTYTNWECWIIDDGSTDGTVRIAAELLAADSRLNYRYQPNQGQPVARNTGIRFATGDFIQFLDADDLLEPDKFAQQLAFLDGHPESDIVYGEVRYFEDGRPELFFDRWGDRNKEWMPKISGSGPPLLTALVNQNIFELGCALFRRIAVDKIGLFNPYLQGVEDYDYCWRCALGSLTFAFLEGSRVLMRHHATSYSKGIISMYKKELQLRVEMDRALRQTPAMKELRALNKERYAWRLRRLQDQIIDQVIKDKDTYLTTAEMKWFYRKSNLQQNLYFFPRIVKAMLLR